MCCLFLSRRIRSNCLFYHHNDMYKEQRSNPHCKIYQYPHWQLGFLHCRWYAIPKRKKKSHKADRFKHNLVYLIYPTSIFPPFSIKIGISSITGELFDVLFTSTPFRFRRAIKNKHFSVKLPNIIKLKYMDKNGSSLKQFPVFYLRWHLRGQPRFCKTGASPQVMLARSSSLYISKPSP